MERKGVDPAVAPFAKAPGEIEGLGLREGANLVKVLNAQLLMLSIMLEKILVFATRSPSKMLTLVWFLYIGANCCGVFLHSINKLIGLTLLSRYVANAINSTIVSIYLSSSVCYPITLTFANHILAVRE
ncbi:uncharacterized protein LOC114320517 [Camellia sinensis]|uniref:uncharacterized protein LOC114320517 n=1 Tax=Camellia sinensis TaxID=4442 RepID=UPI00103699E6|nr:uncharacterized protein LOC114320517 [Camellia sinensis]